MDLKTIGVKGDFAIEHDSELYSQDLLRLRIWVGGVMLGTLDETTYLPSFLPDLEGLAVPADCANAGENEESDSDEIYEKMYSFGESFDDFFIWRKLEGNSVKIKFRLVDRPFHKYPDLAVGEFYSGATVVSSILAVHEALADFWGKSKDKMLNRQL